MRELLLDAAEAVWWLATAPLRKIVADAVQEGIARERRTVEDAAALKWAEPPELELPLQMPAPRGVLARLGLRR